MNELFIPEFPQDARTDPSELRDDDLHRFVRDGVDTAVYEWFDPTLRRTTSTPPIPPYGKAGGPDLPRWKEAVAGHRGDGTGPPLKAVSTHRLRVGVLESWGVDTTAITPEVFKHINVQALFTSARQTSTPALRQYASQLRAFRWVTVLDWRQRARCISLRGFPVLKSDGLTTRWIVDCRPVNAAYTGPTATSLPRVEIVLDVVLFFRGGREDDGVGWYGQFELSEPVQRLFAMTLGSLLVLMTVLPQGFSAAARLAQDTLVTIYRVAYGALITTTFAAFGYLDNALTLSNSERVDRDLRQRAEARHREANAQFEMGAWSETITFIGMVVTTVDGRYREVALKDKWAVRASSFLQAIASATTEPPHAVRRQVLGILLWVVRVLRLPYTTLSTMLTWMGANETTDEHRRLLRETRFRRRLIALHDLNSITVVATDATPTRYAAAFFRPRSIDWSVERNHVLRSTERSPLSLLGERALEAVRYDETVYVLSTRYERVGRRRTRIDGMELLAILLAVAVAPPNGILLVLTDSIVAKGWTRRGLAHAPWANTILSVLCALCYSKQVRLLLMYVPSKFNPADKYSRDVVSHGFHYDTDIAKVPLGPIEITPWI